MSRQEAIFREGEGDNWHTRNLGKQNPDIAFKEIVALNIKPTSILEIGCGNGARLSLLSQFYPSCCCLGIDPSMKAIAYGREHYPAVEFQVGTAMHSLDAIIKNFDVVIYGFCLYLCDRNDLFEIVAKGDLVLKDGGHLVIHDFDTFAPQTIPYHHYDGINSYKMDHSKLWLANPAYHMVRKTFISEEESVTILQKGTWEKFK